MIITADHIRRFPFAVAPHRITDDLQILIAQDMERSARAEGHHKSLPRNPGDQSEQQVAQALMQAKIYRILANGPAAKTHIRDALDAREMGAIKYALEAMLADRRILRFGLGKNVKFQINPYFNRVEAAE